MFLNINCMSNKCHERKNQDAEYSDLIPPSNYHKSLGANFLRSSSFSSSSPSVVYKLDRVSILFVHRDICIHPTIPFL